MYMLFTQLNKKGQYDIKLKSKGEIQNKYYK